ncbi:hypothetical protein D3C85_1782560 [compost metagenome]
MIGTVGSIGSTILAVFLMLVVPAARGLTTVAWKLNVNVPFAGTVKFVQLIV